MAKLKCSELSQVIHDIALGHWKAGAKSFDDVVRIMRNADGRLDRKLIVNSIVEVTAAQEELRQELRAVAEEGSKLDDRGNLPQHARVAQKFQQLLDFFAGKGPKPTEQPKRKRGKKEKTEQQQQLEYYEKLLAAHESPAGMSRLAREWQQHFIENGIRDRVAVLEAVHKELQTAFPDITIRAVQDAISGYGQYVEPSDDEIKKTIAEHKTDYQLLSKLEDMQKYHKRPKKTGRGRYEATEFQRQKQKEVYEASKDPSLIDEGEAKRRLHTALENRKKRTRQTIGDLEKQIKTRKKLIKDRKAPPRDSEMDALIEKRDKLRAEYNEIFGKEQSDAQRLAAAMNATYKSMREYQRKIDQRDFSRKAARSVPVTPELAELRKQRDAARDEYNRLNPDRPNVVALRETLATLRKHLGEGTLPQPKEKKTTTDAEADRLRELIKETQGAIRDSEPAIRERFENTMADLEQRLIDGDYAAPVPREQTELSPELLRMQAQIDNQRRRIKARIRQLQPKNWWTETTTNPFNFFRAIMASSEASMMLIQGNWIALTRPKLAAIAFKEMWGGMRTHEDLLIAEQKLIAHPDYPYAHRAGVFFHLEDSTLNQKEEALQTEWLDRMEEAKGLKGKLARAAFIPLRISNRAYVVYLNQLRLLAFSDMMHATRPGGANAKEQAQIGAMVNTVTGRPSLGKHGEPMGVALNTLMWAPRLAWSRFQIATGWHLLKPGQELRVRKQIMKDYARYMATVVGTIMLARMFWGDDEDFEATLDPFDSDFGKLRWGDTRVNLTGGLSQTIVLMARTLGGEVHKGGGKKRKTVTALRDSYTFTGGLNHLGFSHKRAKKVPYGGKDVWANATQFGTYKLAPLPSTMIQAANMKSAVGEPYEGGGDFAGKKFGRWTGEGLEALQQHELPLIDLGELTAPMSYQDIGKVFESQGVSRGMMIYLLNFMGANAQVYE